jgi:hypothetical protein
MVLPLDSFAARYLLYTGVHFVADFSQSNWMAVCKARPKSRDDRRPTPWWEVLAYHVAMYTGFYIIVAFMLAAIMGHGFDIRGPLWVGFWHAVIDILKSIGTIKRIWVDQLLHLLFNIPPVYWGWL